MTRDMVPPCTDGDTEAQDSSAQPLLLAFVSNPHAKNQQTCVVLIPNLATSHPQPISFLIHAPTLYHQTMVTATKDPRLPLQSPPSLQRSEEPPPSNSSTLNRTYPFPCSVSSILPFNSLQPHQQAKPPPTPGPLHWPLTLPGIFIPWTATWLSLSSALGLCSNIIHLFLVS